MTRGTVYKLFADDGGLLYVGASMNGAQRLGSHRSKPWWPSVARAEFEHFESIEEAQAREADLIRTRDPQFNVAGKRAGLTLEEARRRRADREAARWYDVADVFCTNCGRDIPRLPKGKQLKDVVCRRCECKTLARRASLVEAVAS